MKYNKKFDPLSIYTSFSSYTLYKQVTGDKCKKDKHYIIINLFPD